MNKDILFRGKTQQGEWVLGYMWTNPIETHILRSGWETSVTLDSAIVIPETVGQYIGRKDKNNREIFEGDIARFDKLGQEILGIIVWQNNFSRFAIKHKDENNDDYFTEISHYLNIEIIGNVFDNCRITEGEIKCLHG